MARLLISAAAGIVVGVITQNPYLGFQTFAAVPAYGPFLVKDEGEPLDEPEGEHDDS